MMNTLMMNAFISPPVFVDCILKAFQVFPYLAFTAVSQRAQMPISEDQSKLVAYCQNVKKYFCLKKENKGNGEKENRTAAQENEGTSHSCKS